MKSRRRIMRLVHGRTLRAEIDRAKLERLKLRAFHAQAPIGHAPPAPGCRREASTPLLAFGKSTQEASRRD